MLFLLLSVLTQSHTLPCVLTLPRRTDGLMIRNNQFMITLRLLMCTGKMKREPALQGLWKKRMKCSDQKGCTKHKNGIAYYNNYTAVISQLFIRLNSPAWVGHKSQTPHYQMLIYKGREPFRAQSRMFMLFMMVKLFLLVLWTYSLQLCAGLRGKLTIRQCSRT